MRVLLWRSLIGLRGLLLLLLLLGRLLGGRAARAAAELEQVQQIGSTIRIGSHAGIVDGRRGSRRQVHVVVERNFTERRSDEGERVWGKKKRGS